MSDSEETRRVVVLGSTGSIGCNTLEVIAHLDSSGAVPMRVAGLAAGSRHAQVAEQAERFGVFDLAVADPEAAAALERARPGARVLAGPGAALELVERVEASDVIAAMVGSAGLPATLAAARRGLRIGLANKETLVAAGALVTPLVREHGASLLPVDSEHSAIFQCLAAQPERAVRRLVLTASGGPFRQASRGAIENATVEEALAHPTWKMGPKITIDSATMMNKALEVIEAHWLFGVPGDRIEVIVHPQSTVHSFVEFTDGSVLAQLGPPDMKHPIQYALTWPDRHPGCSQALDWRALSRLDFEPPDGERFPVLALAWEVIEAGGTAGAIFNAAGEAAVEAFLAGRIRFGRIARLVRDALGALEARPVHALEDVLEADRRARAYVNERLG